MVNALSKYLMKFTDRVYRFFERKPHAHKLIYYLLIVSAIAVGIYLRTLPYRVNGLELLEADTYIEYWQAKYVYEKGPLAWYTLTRSNPDTHIFWYPWGRDFTTTSYPGLPVFIGLTYHVVRHFGLSLKDWVAITPLVFATLSYITLILAVKELTLNNKFAIVASQWIYTFVPSVSERNMIGWAEKEGVAITFIFLTVFFYAKLLRVINDKKIGDKYRFIYAISTGLSLGAVGWFWGGFIYFFGSFVAFWVLSPILVRKEISFNYVYFNYVVLVSTIVSITASPAILASLGIAPFRLTSIGVIMMSSLILLAIYYALGVEHRRLRLKKPLLTPGRYFLLLFIVGATAVALYSLGLIHISARYAWALGLRALKPAPPIVESIAEHQSPLQVRGALGVFKDWGTGLTDQAAASNTYLLAAIVLAFVSPLILAIAGAIYSLYRGDPAQVFISLAFALGFYSYLNATYMATTASSTGVVVASIACGYILSNILPPKTALTKWRKGKAGGYSATTSYIAILLTALISINLALCGYSMYQSHREMHYSLTAGGVSIADYNNAWYRLFDFLKTNLSEKAVVVSWWDYGYWITVGGGKITVADGSTLNSTQISVLGRILTCRDDKELVELLKLLKLPPGETYILTYDVFRFENKTKTGNETIYNVSPLLTPSGGVYTETGYLRVLSTGANDIPKSRWMIKIGGRDISDYFYVYNMGSDVVVSPRLDNPDELGLIYRIMIDGILYLGEVDPNATYIFSWFTGEAMPVQGGTIGRVAEAFEVKYQVNVRGGQVKTILPEQRPFRNHSIIQPYYVIVEPYQRNRGDTWFYAVVICIYKVNF